LEVLIQAGPEIHRSVSRAKWAISIRWQQARGWGQVRAQPGEGALAAATGRVKQTVLTGHRRPHLVAGVKFQVDCPSRSCPHCVHSGAHASDDPGRPQDPSEDAVNAGRWLAGKDGLAVASIAGTFVRCRPLQVFCPVALARSSALMPPCTLQGPLHRARMNSEAEGLLGPVRKLASTIERAPWLPAVAIDIAPGTDHYPHKASSPSTQ
jgi:hypothetical protein